MLMNKPTPSRFLSFKTFNLSRIICLFFLVLISIPVFPQTDKNAKYFDDGGIADTKNVLKIGLTSIIIGDLPIFYERVLSRSASLEFGVGLLLPYYNPEIIQLIFNNSVITNPDGGFSLWLEPKFYVYDSAPQEYYLSLLLRRRQYSQDGDNIVFYDFIGNVGYQLFFKSKYVTDLSYGMGLRYIDGPESIQDEIDSGVPIQFVFQINIKMGLKL